MMVDTSLKGCCAIFTILQEFVSCHRSGGLTTSRIFCLNCAPSIQGYSELEHAPFTRSVLCGAWPSGSDRDRTVGCADCRRRGGLGHRYLPCGKRSVGNGGRLDLRGYRRGSKCLSHGPAMAEELRIASRVRRKSDGRKSITSLRAS